MRLILLVLALMMAPQFGVLAADGSLYMGEVRVADQGEAERRRALPRALGNVLQKISGLRQFDDHPLVEPTLQRAPNMVLSYYYRNVDLLLGDGGVLAETRLVARFSEREINNLARSLSLPLWRAERSAIEVWLVIDDGRERRILPLEYEYVRGTLNDIAAMRGLPLEWPVADEEGNYPVDMQLIWGGYSDELVSADGSGVLILAARREGLEWSVRSNLGYGNDNWAWREQGIELETVLVESLHQSVDNIAAANTIAAADQGVWQHQLTIRGLRNSRDYQRCLDYLAAVSTVSRVDVLSARSNQVDFELELSALPQYLVDTLARDGVLDQSGEEGVYVLLHGEADGR